ncbi:MAG: hypothetical protein ACOC6F_03535 [bacterium]
MIRSLFVRALSVLQLLSKRLRMIFHRRSVFLVDDKSLPGVLAGLGLQPRELDSCECSSCGRTLTTDSIAAWMVTSEGIVFYCDAIECLAGLTHGEKRDADRH